MMFLYLCAQIKTAGAINVTKNRMEKYIHITVRDRLATRRTAEIHDPAVINSHTAFEQDVCRRRRRIGNSAKDRIENNTSANTDTLVERRDANTTDADTAAFIDNTDESPSLISSSDTFAV